MPLKLNSLMQLIISAVCLALCMVLPFLTGQIPQIGSALSPMHLPVLLCGFLCGPVYAPGCGRGRAAAALCAVRHAAHFSHWRGHVL